MKQLLFVLIICIASISFVSCKKEVKQTSITKKIAFTKEGNLSIAKKGTDSIYKKLSIEFAEGEYQTQTGLMYRSSMATENAMLFIFNNETPRSFYMKNTEIGLDIIYVNSDKQIVSIQKNAKPMDPTSLPSNAPAKYVLEINAGLSDAWNIEVGDRISWNRL